jgi:hypothetical protein
VRMSGGCVAEEHGSTLSRANICSILSRPERMFVHGTIDMALSERQLRILTIIEEAVQAQGYPPTVREIGAAVGLCSPASVHNHLAVL